jgi:hypothetical protein
MKKWILGLMLLSATAWGAIEWGDLSVKGNLAVTGTSALTGDTTAGVVGVTQLNADNIRLDGNTVSTTNTDGNLTFDLNGTGKIILSDLTASTILSLNGSKELTSLANPLTVANGGTGLATGTSGGVLAFTAAGTLASSGALTANQLVIGGGAGVVPSVLAAGSQYQVLVMGAANPGYGQVNLSQSAAITGTLPVGNGGTGLTGGTSGGVPYYSGSTTIASSGALTANHIVLGGGAGAAPTVLASLGTTSTVLHGNAAGAPTFGTIVNADVDAAAAIAYSKLNLTGQILVADLDTDAANANKVYTFNGSGVPTAALVTATNVSSGVASNGDVLTANGSGAASWASLGAATATDTFNYAQNGEARFFQRQDPAAFRSIQDDQYGPDRWYALTSGGATAINVTRTAESPSAYTTTYAMQWRQADATARQYGMAQILESKRVIGLRGGAVTFAFDLRTDSTEITTVRACIGEWTGAVDNVTSDVVSSWGATPTWIASFACANTPADITINSSWAQYSISATLGSSFNNLVLFIWTPNTEAQNDDFYATQIQLVRGSAAYNWGVVQKTYEEDYIEVARFYEKTFDIDTEPARNTGAGGPLNAWNGGETGADTGGVVWAFKVEKYASCSTTTFNPNSNASGFSRSGAGNIAVTISSINRRQASLRMAAAMAANGTFQIHASCDAEL